MLARHGRHYGVCQAQVCFRSTLRHFHASALIPTPPPALQRSSVQHELPAVVPAEGGPIGAAESAWSIGRPASAIATLRPCSAQYDVLLMVGRGGYGGGGEDAQERRQQGSRVHHLILSSSLRANARFVQPHDFVHGCDDARDTPMTMQTKRHRIQPTTTAILPNSTSRIMFVHRGGLAITVTCS